MKRISEEQAVNAQAKAFIKTLPDCRCEELEARVKELEEKVCNQYFLLGDIESLLENGHIESAQEMITEALAGKEALTDKQEVCEWVEQKPVPELIGEKGMIIKED